MGGGEEQSGGGERTERGKRTTERGERVVQVEERGQEEWRGRGGTGAGQRRAAQVLAWGNAAAGGRAALRHDGHDAPPVDTRAPNLRGEKGGLPEKLVPALFVSTTRAQINF